MRKVLTMLLLSGALGGLVNPAPADAVKLTNCLGEALDSCDSDFGGATEKVVGIRGWCYLIRWGMCSVLGG